MQSKRNDRPEPICWRRWRAAVQNVHTNFSRNSRQITLRTVVETPPRDDARRLRRLRRYFWERGVTVAPSRIIVQRGFGHISEGNPPSGVSGFVLVVDAKFLHQPSGFYVQMPGEPVALVGKAQGSDQFGGAALPAGSLGCDQLCHRLQNRIRRLLPGLRLGMIQFPDQALRIFGYVRCSGSPGPGSAGACEKIPGIRQSFH